MLEDQLAAVAAERRLQAEREPLVRAQIFRLFMREFGDRVEIVWKAPPMFPLCSAEAEGSDGLGR